MIFQKISIWIMRNILLEFFGGRVTITFAVSLSLIIRVEAWGNSGSVSKILGSRALI